MGSVLIAVLTLAIIVYAYLQYGDLLNPVSIFLPAWLLPYALYILYPYPPADQIRLSIPAHLIILATTGCFLAGHLLARPWRVTPKGFGHTFVHSKPVIRLALLSMTGLATIAFWLQFQGAGGAEMLLTDSGAFERNFFQGPLLDDVFNLIILAAFLAFLIAIYEIPSFTILAIVALGGVMTVLTLHRMFVIVFLCPLLVAVNYYVRRYRLTDAIAIAAAGIGTMIGIIASLSWGLTGGMIGRAGVIYGSPLLTNLYWYIAMGIRNVEVLYQQFGLLNLDAPARSLMFLWAFLGLKDEMGIISGVDKGAMLRQLVDGWTAKTILFPFMVDLGVVGALVGMFVLGYGVSRFYRAIRAQPSPIMVFSYGLIVSGLLLAFFTNQFTKPLFWKLFVQAGLLVLAMNVVDNTIFNNQWLDRTIGVTMNDILEGSVFYTMWKNSATRTLVQRLIKARTQIVRKAAKTKQVCGGAWQNSATKRVFDGSQVVSGLRKARRIVSEPDP